MNQVTWQLDFIGAKGCNSHLLLPKERLNLLKQISNLSEIVTD